MSTPDSPKRLVRELIKRHRMSQAKITEALLEDGVEVSQPTISRIANGHEDIRLDLFRGLARLHERITQQLVS